MNVSRRDLPSPSKEEMALLPEFPRLGPTQVVLVRTEAEARAAMAELVRASAWGFDTESKPTFKVGESSDGPHVVQFSLSAKAWVFQLADPACKAVVCELLELGGVAKLGFGLGDDQKRIAEKLGAHARGIVDLNHVLRRMGYRKDLGARGSIATLFNQRFVKSKKAAVSNWANATLTPTQILYAANDAYAALRAYEAAGSPSFAQMTPEPEDVSPPATARGASGDRRPA